MSVLRILGILIALAFLGGLAWYIYPKANMDYRSAIKANTIDGYKHFLATYPNDRRGQEILKRIDDIAWKTADTSHTAAPIEAYLRSYPNGPHVPEAYLRLGDMSLAPDQGEKDFAKAREYFGKACDDGAGRGCRELAVAYEIGASVPRDHSQSAVFLERGCHANDATSCFNLAYQHEYGIGVAKDPALALSYYQKACSIDHNRLACSVAASPSSYKVQDTFDNKLMESMVRAHMMDYFKIKGADPNLLQIAGVNGAPFKSLAYTRAYEMSEWKNIVNGTTALKTGDPVTYLFGSPHQFSPDAPLMTVKGTSDGDQGMAGIQSISIEDGISIQLNSGPSYIKRNGRWTREEGLLFLPQ